MNNRSHVTQLCRRKILHVDGYPANIELIQQIIDRRDDLKLITATSGAQCVQLARTHLPAVILMETILCDMNGVALMKILRRDDDTVNIPVIALSSDALPSRIDAAMNAGFYSYLTKPFEIKGLMRAIDVALQYPTQSHDVFNVTPSIFD